MILKCDVIEYYVEFGPRLNILIPDFLTILGTIQRFKQFIYKYMYRVGVFCLFCFVLGEVSGENSILIVCIFGDLNAIWIIARPENFINPTSVFPLIRHSRKMKNGSTFACKICFQCVFCVMCERENHFKTTWKYY